MEDRTTREMITQILAEEWPLTARVIFNRVKKGKSLTYQAVYKTLSKMTKEEVLIRKQMQYSLNLLWITKSKDFFNQIESSYKEHNFESIPYAESYLHDYVKYPFKNIIGLGDYLANYFLNFPHKRAEPTIFHWFRAYSLIGLSKETNQEIKKIAKRDNVYIINKSDRVFDKLISKAYAVLSKKIHIKSGIELKEDCDYIAVGDYVAKIYFSPIWMEQMTKFTDSLKSIASFNLRGLLDLMHADFEPAHYVIVEKNPEFADYLRKETLRYFKK